MQPEGSDLQTKIVSLSPDPHPEERVTDTPPKKPTTTNTKILIALTFVLTMVILGVFVALLFSLFSRFPAQCTKEALACPDGTTVERVGPECKFAPCPAPLLK